MFRIFTTFEKVLILILLAIVVSTSVYLYGRFIRDNSNLIAADGGIYTEGLVGRPLLLNPVLLMGNPVDKDISQVIFSGLTRYNPHTGLIEDDIATSEKSKDNLTYTFTLVPDAFWHNGVPVSADDVVFTYQSVIQNEAFPNVALRQMFSDVTVKKIDDRTVQFQLDNPYSFFLANVTIGLLPKHLYELIPVDNLDKSEINQAPVGTGPYKFATWTVKNDTYEVTLQRNDQYYGTHTKITTLIFRSFHDQDSLLLAENTLTGFRLSTDKNPKDVFGDTSRFDIFPYHLPQYSSLFLNTDSDILNNRMVRFALLLATDKEEIRDAVGDVEIVDTSILESKLDLDIEFSLERARGAFFDTEWNIPSKVESRKEQEEEPKSTGGPELDQLIADATELKFILTASQDSWISLAVDGVDQTSFLLSAGKTKEFSAKTALTLRTVGNAAGLQVEMNGLQLKSLGGAGQVVRNIVFDRQTISQYVDETLLPPPPSTPEAVSDTPKPSEEPVPAEEDKPDLPLEVQPELSGEEVAELDKVRINDNGERLILRLVTAQEPASFLRVAELVRKQWLEAGAKVIIETYSLQDLQEKIKNRDYDILLFGQNLGYNLDAFPFWHSSQSGTGLNLSNYRSLESDNFLVDIRRTFDERTKQELLDRLKKEIAHDTPAVFLYNPTHYYLVAKSVKNVQLGKLSSHSDRFTDLPNWYVKEDYDLKEPFSFSQLFSWIFTF
ncbi:MAG: DUF4115 domain-containing protein [bacterium]|nr:DUF4115 domain-containing protein [bacterium]